MKMIAIFAVLLCAVAATHGCKCITDPDPVCGDNGKTYRNSCYLKCENIGKEEGDRVNEAYKGCCVKEKKPCICSFLYAPVCGVDNQTYSNECLLNCALQKTDDEDNVCLQHQGQCMAQNDSCICPLNYQPVCGTDGQTYSNQCLLNCQKPSNPDLCVAYEGPCSEPVARDDGCICTLEYNPVCGSDGMTYGNMCALNCQQRSNTDLTVAHEGAC